MEAEELLAIADTLDQAVGKFNEECRTLLPVLSDTVDGVSAAWSGSNLGYHSTVYYEDLKRPPVGARFSVQDGLRERFTSDTRGNWEEYRYEDVIEALLSNGRKKNFEDLEKATAKLDALCADSRQTIASILSIISTDEFIETLKTKVHGTTTPSKSQFSNALIRGGQILTGDMDAISGGTRIAPHQAIQGTLIWANTVPLTASKIANLARQAGSHLSRLSRSSRRSALIGTNVFIGHGRSNDWRELKDFLKERLHLPYDEFNRVPVAGVTNTARLSEMLDSAAIAFLVLTSEDETRDGQQRAKQNVIHEVGLFQGRLGFTRAIVLLEEGCEEFSNIQGLGQIRFPTGRISAAFEEIRAVLEREEILDAT